MTLMQMSLSGAVMILVIAALRCLFLNTLPKQTFPVLWWIALARLLLPYTLPSRLSIYSIINRSEPVHQEAAKLPAVLFTPTLSPLDRPAPSPAAAPPAAEPSQFNIWGLIWAVGAIACFAWFALSYIRCRREFQTSLPVHNDYIRHWLRIHRLRRRISIRQTAGISAPLTYGVLRPVILLPKSTDWADAVSLRYVLEHEYIHIRRFDAASKLLFTAALCIHWFNPAVWLLYFLVNRDMELSCDEAVIRLFGQDSRTKYARTLIHMEETKSGLMPLANGFSKNAIEERIVAIMKTKKITLLVSVIALVLVTATVILFATSAKAEKTAPTAEHAAVPIQETTAAPAGLLDRLTVDLTANITRQKVSDTRDEFVRNGQVIGGIVVTDLGSDTVNDMDKLVNYLETHIIEGLSPADYDYYMSTSGPNVLIGVECGTLDRYFTHYIYEGNSAYYDLWFEDPLSNTGEVQQAVASVQSDDIPALYPAVEGKQDSAVELIKFDNFSLPDGSWTTEDLMELLNAVAADTEAGTMIPAAPHAQFHFEDGAYSIFDNGPHDAPYILLCLFTNVDCLTYTVYPECESVMAWMEERNVLETMKATVIPAN